MRQWLIVLLLGFTVATHLVRINVPIVDQHAHRQTTTASIARNFYETNAKQPTDRLTPDVGCCPVTRSCVPSGVRGLSASL